MGKEREVRESKEGNRTVKPQKELRNELHRVLKALEQKYGIEKGSEIFDSIVTEMSKDEIGES